MYYLSIIKNDFYDIHRSIFIFVKEKNNFLQLFNFVAIRKSRNSLKVTNTSRSRCGKLKKKVCCRTCQSRWPKTMIARKHSWIGISSGLFPRAGHGSTKIYPRDYKDYAEIESLPSHPARMPKCVSGKLSLNHRVFTRGRYRASDPKLHASCSELHIVKKRSLSRVTSPRYYFHMRVTSFFFP